MEKSTLTQKLDLYLKFKRYLLLLNSYNIWSSFISKCKLLTLKKKTRIFINWLKYAKMRKTRKEQRKSLKIKGRLFIRLIRNRIRIARTQALSKWKKEVETIEREKGNKDQWDMIEQVQKDVHQANRQIRIMRQIVGMVKIKAVIETRIKILESSTWYKIKQTE